MSAFTVSILATYAALQAAEAAWRQQQAEADFKRRLQEAETARKQWDRRQVSDAVQIECRCSPTGCILLYYYTDKTLVIQAGHCMNGGERLNLYERCLIVAVTGRTAKGGAMGFVEPHH